MSRLYTFPAAIDELCDWPLAIACIWYRIAYHCPPLPYHWAPNSQPACHSSAQSHTTLHIASGGQSPLPSSSIFASYAMRSLTAVNNANMTIPHAPHPS
ncbi:hypothetical protein IG631_22240 [Alternaria alternata]|nr:hypothetical protein IG631_22240 [Alternaria alternata]